MGIAPVVSGGTIGCGNSDSGGVAKEWWDAIDRGDFVAAARLCAKSAVVEWPLSN
ncbi:MAG: hypothetical protein H0W23_08770, partial [Chloroflexia bacterium]|nr:hypothetical protein [Chloroflexia bacterium]